MYDKEIGMYYLIARYYQPEHGVFLSVDPDPGDSDDPLTQNGYTYGNNNPMMMVDPDGNSPKIILIIKGVKLLVKGGKHVYKHYKKVSKSTAKPTSSRLKYMGRTPSKSSKTGRQVINRMNREGTVRTVRGKTQFLDSRNKWRPLNEADMAHRTDAVTWWNAVGRNYGPKSREVRKLMLDSDNYYLEYYHINRSQGASLRRTYLPPK